MGVRTYLFSCLAMGALLGAPVRAETIYDNGPPNLDVGYPSSDFAFGSQYADDFVLGAGASTIRDIHWYGSYGGAAAPDADNFVIKIYPDDEDRPPLDDYQTANITAGPLRVQQAESALSGPLYRYSVVIDPVALVPNTRYWMSIVNTTSSADWQWAISVAGDGESAWRPTVSFEDWRVIDGANANASFEFTDDGTIPEVPEVPEPSTVCLALLGVIGICAWRTRRCKLR